MACFRSGAMAIVLAFLLVPGFACQLDSEGAVSEDTGLADSLPPGGYLYFPSSVMLEQEASNWCWAACVEGAISGILGSGSTISQEEIVKKMFDGVPLDRGATIQQIVQSIDGYTYRYEFQSGGGFIDYRLSAYAVPGLPSPELLLQSSTEYLQVLTGGDYAIILALQHHAVTLCSCHLEQEDGIRVGSLVVNDPWPRRGMRTIPRAEALNPLSQDFVQAAIIIAVTETPGNR